MKTSPRWRLFQHPILLLVLGILAVTGNFWNPGTVQARGPWDSQNNSFANRGHASGNARYNAPSGPAASSGPQRQSTFREPIHSATPRTAPSVSSPRSEPIVRSAPQRMNFGSSGFGQGNTTSYRSAGAAPAGNFSGRFPSWENNRSGAYRSSAPFSSVRTDSDGRSAPPANTFFSKSSFPDRIGGTPSSADNLRNGRTTKFQNDAAPSSVTASGRQSNTFFEGRFQSGAAPTTTRRDPGTAASSFQKNPPGTNASSGIITNRFYDADTNRLQQRFRTLNPSALAAVGGKTDPSASGNNPKRNIDLGNRGPAKSGVKNPHDLTLPKGVGSLGNKNPRDATLPKAAGSLGKQTIKTPPGNLGKTGVTRLDPNFGKTVKPGDVHLPNSLITKGGDLKQVRGNLQSGRFPARLKSGQLEMIGKAPVAKKIHLDEQFKMAGKGDVARRLDLQKNMHHLDGAHPGHPHPAPAQLYALRPAYYHGWVHPLYVNSCFRFNYFGPGFFAGFAWYPHWNPWVAWSWNFHCHPLWDPRPWWCRPIYYDPCPAWVYWQVPVWTPLPVAVCGTWVDVPEAPVAVPEQFDLQLLAVRFVDPGHPEEKLGPRYRVWFRNNSTVPITTPFDVMLLAGNDKQIRAGLPGQGVRVQAINPGDVQSVDIRLPIEVTTMNRDATGQPAPFAVLHVLVDANRTINDVVRINNGVDLSRDAVLPVDPAAFSVEPAPNGAAGELQVAGEGLGPLPGQALIHVAGK
jgi:hypothetical protein